MSASGDGEEEGPAFAELVDCENSYMFLGFFFTFIQKDMWSILELHISIQNL